MVYEAMATGEILANCSGGGGGWGNPYKRDPEKVLDDVRNGYVSVTGAKRDYGIVIDEETMTVDVAATARLREKTLS
jgi:N-methylhydantoinase B